MRFCITVRKKQQTEEKYLPLKGQQLKTQQKLVTGNGTARNPYIYEITVQNLQKERWEGVVQIELLQQRQNPEFFLPAFMYGTNRGDTPMEGKRLYPRIALRQEMPAAGWWMVRGDRLSHPAALIYDSGHIFGFHASPYWTIDGGKKTDHFGREKEFFQYAGYTCHAERCIEEEDGEESKIYCSVGYTLGYENAPWLFVDSHDVRERAELNEQCFSLEAEECATFFMYVYDFCAKERTEIHRVLENVYEFYHEAPPRSVSVETAVCDLATAVMEDAWLPERNAYSLFAFMRPEEDTMTYRELESFFGTSLRCTYGRRLDSPRLVV